MSLSALSLRPVEDMVRLAAFAAQHDPHPWGAAQFQASCQFIFTGAFLNEELVGLLVHRDLAGDVEVLNLVVAKKQRRLGVASQLLATLPNPCYLEVRRENVAAQECYQRNGFEVEGVRKAYYTEPQDDAIIMKRCGLD